MIRSLFALSFVVSSLSFAQAASLRLYTGPNQLEPSAAKKSCVLAVTDAKTIEDIKEAMSKASYEVYSTRGGHSIMVGATIIATANLGDKSVDLVRNTDTMNLTNTSAAAKSLFSQLVDRCN